MAQIINGKLIAQQLRQQCAEEAEQLKAAGITPKLAVIIVGDDPASRQYVNSRAEDCKAVGMDSAVFALPADTPQAKLITLIDGLNNDSSVHGILLQLPLPKHINSNEVTQRISCTKDVDGCNMINIGALASGLSTFEPCTPSGIMRLIDSTGVEISGKNAVIIGRSNVVGKPAAMLMLRRNATVTICHSKTPDLSYYTKQADILIAAVGKPGLVTGDMVKPGAVVIDAGINRVGGKTVGDVEFSSAAEKAAFITPVPGGVGPMTRTVLLLNTLRAARSANGK